MGKTGADDQSAQMAASPLPYCLVACSTCMYMTKPLFCDQAAWKIRRGLMLDTTNHNIAQEGCKVNETGRHTREGNARVFYIYHTSVRPVRKKCKSVVMCYKHTILVHKMLEKV